MSGPYVMVEQRRVTGAQTRAECVALALVALYWIDRAGALIDDAIKRCEDSDNG